MTLIFSGNDYKYELESIVKLFFPAQLFTHLYDKRNAEGDLCFMRKKQGKKYFYLYAYVRIGDEKTHLCSRLSADTDNLDNSCELELCRLLFLCLEKLTGIKPQWGLITGVRPVKRINRMRNKGIEDGSIKKILSDKYLVSDEKLRLAFLTADTQERILSKLDKKSFSLYVSIPFCPTRCSYCSFVSQTLDKVKTIIPQYIENICREIEYTFEIAEKLGLVCDTVYFGGGTPTSITAQQLEKIMKTVSSCVDISALREYTVEAGRADTITREKLEVIKSNGATRISINPQTFNDDVLVAIGRRHTAKDVCDSFALAREIGFDDINMDLIAGLPTDTSESFVKTIDTALKLAPENITVHTLSIKRAADLNHGSREVLNSPVPSMVSYASLKLLENGYSPYYLYRQKNTLGNLENTGYSLNGKESLYNIYIMEEVQTIIAVGAGASTKLVSNTDIKRIYNYKHPLEYNNHFELMLQKKNEVLDFFNGR